MGWCFVMRKRIFIDCDDTLLIYDSIGERHPLGYLQGESYHINESLVDSIRAWAYDNPCSMVVVWSGGGADYARTVTNIVFPYTHGIQTMKKDRTTFYLVRAGDIVIDDMADSVEVLTKVFRPDEWRYP